MWALEGPPAWGHARKLRCVEEKARGRLGHLALRPTWPLNLNENFPTGRDAKAHLRCQEIPILGVGTAEGTEAWKACAWRDGQVPSNMSFCDPGGACVTSHTSSPSFGPHFLSVKEGDREVTPLYQLGVPVPPPPALSLEQSREVSWSISEQIPNIVSFNA